MGRSQPKSLWLRNVTVFFAATMLLAASRTAQAQNSYSIRMLGTLGGSYSFATDVNSKNQVVGGSWRAGGSIFNGDERAFLWESGVMRDLGALAGDYSVATSINEAGEIVGRSYPTPNYARPHACLWLRRADGSYEITDLNTLLSPEDRSQWELLAAININDHHQVSVRGERFDPVSGANLGTYAGVLNLTTTPAALTLISRANSPGKLNNLASPQVVGRAGNVPYVFDTATGTLSSDLPGLSSADGINDAGEIVGASSSIPGPAYRSASGQVASLGTFGGSTGLAVDINNGSSRVVIGYAENARGNLRAFRWRVGTSAKEELSRLVKGGKATLRTALGLNDTGYIVGAALTKGEDLQYLQAFLLIPQ